MPNNPLTQPSANRFAFSCASGLFSYTNLHVCPSHLPTQKPEDLFSYVYLFPDQLRPNPGGVHHQRLPACMVLRTVNSSSFYKTFSFHRYIQFGVDSRSIPLKQTISLLINGKGRLPIFELSSIILFVEKIV